MPQHLKYPLYKVDTSNGVMVTDHNGNILGKGTEEQTLTLLTLKSYSPSIIEKAVKTKFSDGLWHNYVELLKYKY